MLLTQEFVFAGLPEQPPIMEMLFKFRNMKRILFKVFYGRLKVSLLIQY